MPSPTTDLAKSNGHRSLDDAFWRAAADVGQNIEPKSFSDALFSKLIIDARLQHQFISSWATQIKSIPDSAGRVLFATDNSRHNTTRAILEVEGVLVRIHLELGHAQVRMASTRRSDFEALSERLKAQLPEPVIGPGEQKVPFRFSWLGGDGQPRWYSQILDVVRWEDVEKNYCATTRAQLARLVSSFEADRSGQTVIWHGEPGTGKTSALRALSFEWRDRCDFTIVTDPDALFGSGAGYVMETLTTWVPEGDRWRVIVLEDAGELLCGDARKYVGQGLSRFLNICDGLLGQLQNVMLLVTTNEPLRRMHPAVRRPGRCAAEVEFQPFGVDEANAWLAGRCDERVSAPTTLAALYALAAHSVPLESHDSWPGIGFGSAI